MTAPSKCDVCGGSGTYPIFDQRGSQRYSITCPECFGDGCGEPPTASRDPSLPPASTAAHIKSMDDLRAWQRKQAR